MTNLQETIDILLANAAKTYDSGDAMRFTQAVLNVAHAHQVLSSYAVPPTPRAK